ncbi:MAG TPA: RNA 2',3'-cyclic phosphodiesterase [Candidatus Acidoferrum sp.]|jgi:2'-5' RNA ligase|nr:RNA 2',3'-cyclic phosphodiesterase [Candidatus Acidoferrum sp.]
MRFRLFIAVAIPEEVKAAIETAQNELRRTLPGGVVRWTRREQFHLTLRFLGDVAVAQLAALEGAARQVCARFAPLEMRGEDVGFFPERGLPRVIWVGIKDQAGRLPELQHALQEATLAFSSEAPERRFTGHVTLGRIKDIRRPEAETLTEAGARLAGLRSGWWTAPTIEIMRSELSPTGATHTALAALPLGGMEP